MRSSWIYPIPSDRKAVYEFYQLDFDKNGCPMKKTSEGLVFHPMYGSYLIQNFCDCYKKTNNFQYIKIAENIADECTKKLSLYKNASVFWYTPESKLSSVPFKFYSALAQTQYMYSLNILYTLTRKYKYLNTISELYNSLLIETKDRGVLINFPWGSIIEEYYCEPPLFTLNGFITATILIMKCRKTLIKCGIIEVDTFIQKLLSGLDHILPLYDASFVCNTRYNLSGYRRLRLLFDKKTDIKINKFSVEIPKLGTFNETRSEKPNRWNNYIERHENRLLQFNLVFSLISYPEKNIFHVEFESDKDCFYQLLLADGDYSPHITAMPTSRWRLISEGKISKGINTINIAIDWDDNNLFAYPTNFKKKISGYLYNAYHFVHVLGLAELYKYTNSDTYKRYSQLWYSYIKKWPEMSIYNDNSLKLVSHIENFDTAYHKYLNSI